MGPTRRHPASWWLAVASFFAATSAFSPALAAWSTDTPIAIRGMEYAPWVVGLICVAALAGTQKVRRAGGPAVAVLLLLLTLCVASSMWSIAPVVTFREVAALGLTTVSAYLFVTRLELAEILRAVSLALLLVACASLVAGIATSAAMNPTSDGLRGVLQAKNMLGRFAATGLLIELALLTIGWRRPGAALVRALVFTLTLVLSNSASAAVVVVVIGAALALTWIASTARRGGFLLIMLAAWIPAAVVLTLSGSALGVLLDLTGRDATLSNRTVIWDSVLAVSSDRLLSGYGWEAFWVTPGSGREQVWAAVGGSIAHGHNGLLDTALGIGLVGVVLVGVLVVLAFRNGIGTVRNDRSRGIALLLMASLPIGFSLTESNLVHGNNVFTALLLIGALWPFTHVAKRPANDSQRNQVTRV